ncbi:MAG TPA: sigma-70 family RNA polymerase sigma factor [Candidatus Bathyarchaeia archaeon]|nr:sigma-70 family RNA polymerase sigma factor [Candidatus Bathyarchaeia archaeon]
MAPDAHLLERWVHDRDADAFAELVARYSGLVYGTCRRILGDPTEAEDVAQEAFIELATRGRAITTSISSWLHTVATHRALNRIRSNKRRTLRERQYQLEQESTGEAGWEEIWRYVDQAIAALPEKYREPIVLRFIDGRTQEFIARELDMPPATVRFRLARGVDEIRNTLRSKGVSVSVVVLGAALAGMESGAAPATLTAALGRLALSGLTTQPAALGAGKLALIGGVAMTTKKAVVVACAVLVILGLGGIMLYRTQKPPQSPRVQPVAAAPIDKNQPAGAAAAPESAVPDAVTPPPPETAPKEEPPKPVILPAAVAGLVSTMADEPMAGASVYLEVLEGGEDLNVAKTYSTTTGADGRYRIDGIDTLGTGRAEASVYASAPGFLMAKLRGLKVKSGDVAEADLRLKEAQYVVAGMVVAQNRQPLPDASVELQYYGYDAEGLETTAASGMTTGNIGDPKFVFALTDPNGNFEIAIPAQGLCDFTVRKDGYGPGFFPQIPTGTRDAVFVLRAPGAIAGHVKNADGMPAAGVKVQVMGAGFPGGLAPYPVWVQPLLLKTVWARSAEDGSYQADGLGEEYWYRVAVPVPSLLEEEKLLAQVLGVNVQAGKTTTGVDLVLPPEGKETAIFGTVTDIASGDPVYPMAVDVLPVDRNPLSGLASPVYSSVFPDGSFRIVLNITAECDVICRHRYETEGGGVWWDPEGQTVRIKPYEEKEVNFSVAAPFNVELEYVDEAGAPLPGIMTAMRRAEGRGGCGGSLISDPDGRATMHGLPPGIPLVAMGWQEVGGRNLITIGCSEPFTGSAGQTVSGVRVVCRPVTGVGGVSGALAWPDGIPVAQTMVYCRTMWAGSQIEESVAISAADGSFTSGSFLPEGVYPELAVGFEDDQGRIYGAIVNDVTISNGQTTPLGTLTVAQAPPE